MAIASDGSTQIWYLSGGASNSDPALSLGGLRSSTAITSDQLNNLFDDVTGDEAATGQTEYRCVYYRNEDADAGGAVDPTAWISEQPHAYLTPFAATGETLEIGLDLAGKNATADTIAAGGLTAPDPAVTFDDPATKGAGLVFPSGPYAENDYCALWIKRITPSSQAYSAGTKGVIAFEVGTV
jgi:hypothetical protein